MPCFCLIGWAASNFNVADDEKTDQKADVSIHATQLCLKLIPTVTNMQIVTEGE